MKRIAVILLTAVALLGTGLAGPASATSSIPWPPPGCTLAAGKIAAWTSTSNRSVDLRWPGLTCSSTESSMSIGVVLYTDWAGVWKSGPVVGGTFQSNVSSLPGASTVASCKHRHAVKAFVVYTVFVGTVQYAVGYFTNVAVCS